MSQTPHKIAFLEDKTLSGLRTKIVGFLDNTKQNPHLAWRVVQIVNAPQENLWVAVLEESYPGTTANPAQ